MGSDSRRRVRRSSGARTWLGLCLGAALLAWVAMRVDLERVWALLLSVHPGWLVAAISVKLMAIPVKGRRWKVVLRSATGGRVRGVVRATWLGFAANAVLPMRLGEVVRIRIVQRHNPALFFAPGLGTVVVERVIDGVLILGVFGSAGLFTIRPDWAREGASVFGALLLSGLAGLILLIRYEGVRRKVLSRLPGFVGRIVNGVFEGFRLLRRPRALVAAVSISVLAWSLEVAGTLLLLRAGSLELGWAAAAFLTSAVALGLTAPSAPAGLGTHQFVYVSVLGALGISAELATALSVLGMTSVAVCLVVGALPLLFIGVATERPRPRREITTVGDPTGDGAPDDP